MTSHNYKNARILGVAFKIAPNPQITTAHTYWKYSEAGEDRFFESGDSAAVENSSVSLLFVAL